MKKITCIFLLCIVSVVLSACSTLSNRAVNPPTPLKNYKQQITVKPLWSVKTGVGSGNVMLNLTPTLKDKVIYTADAAGKITAVNRSNGKILWSNNVKNALASGPDVGDNLIVVGAQDGHIYVLNKNNGSLVWNKNLSDEVLATPIVAHNKVLAKTIDGKLYAFAANHGKLLWEYNETNVSDLILQASSAPVVVNNAVIAGFSNGNLVVLNLNTGQIKWREQIAAPTGGTQVQQLVPIAATPLVQSGSIYAATYQGRIASLSLRSGEVFWQHKLSTYTGLAADKQSIYVTDANGYLWAFDSVSGGVNWRQKSLAYRGLTAPVLMSNMIVVADQQGYLHWLRSRDGRLLGRIQVAKAGIQSAPVVSGKNVYALSNNGYLNAYKVI